MILVLTMGRSGSSLLMQTLRLLGANTVGRDFDEQKGAAHFGGSPGGYVEEPAVFYGGIDSDAARRLPTDAVCKMDLLHFVDDAQFPAWLKAAQKVNAIIFSYRHPLEQARSEYAGQFRGPEDTEANQFQFFTGFLREYVRSWRRVGQILQSELVSYHSKSHFIDYRAIEDPTKYVNHLIRISGLSADTKMIDLAARNIDLNLYRNRRTDFSEKEYEWAERIGTTEIYQQLAAASLPRSNSV